MHFKLDAIFEVLDKQGVSYILLGGVNFLLNHKSILTNDVDIWVEDSDKNLTRLNLALRMMGAQWGATETTWGPIPEDANWLKQSYVFCMTTQFGSLDVFREVLGLEGQYAEAYQRAYQREELGFPYKSLSDEDMLSCQLALPENEQKLDRIRELRLVIERKARHSTE